MTTTSTNNPEASADTIISFITKTFDNARKTTAVIGLSGGIDSATSLFLTAKALGPEHIHAFYLPTKKSNPIHLIDAQKAATAAGLPKENFHLLPITSIIQKSWRIIQRYKTQDTSDKNREELRVLSAQDKGDAEIQEFVHAESIPSQNDARSRTPPRRQGAEDVDFGTKNALLRLANLSARIRMLILFDQAKKLDALVIGTENQSEQMLGYFTRFGDEASDIEPITHLFKTEVIELAKQLGIPESIITKSPSADLWPGQTDAGELGFSYEAADPILRLIKNGKQPTGELAEKIISQVKKAAFKQRVPYHL